MKFIEKNRPFISVTVTAFMAFEKINKFLVDATHDRLVLVQFNQFLSKIFSFHIMAKLKVNAISIEKSTIEKPYRKFSHYLLSLHDDFTQNGS